jgi:hypothetical protein
MNTRLAVEPISPLARACAVSLLGLLACTCASATTTVCVTDAAGLQAALNAADGSTDTTVIEVARGTYNVGGSPLSFHSTSMTQGQLDITGGYNADCSALIKNPALTVLDGAGVSRVLDIVSANGISVRYLTIQNGAAPSNFTGGMIVESTNGGVIVDYNIFRNNSATNFAGLGAYIFGPSATSALHVDGNLIVGNSASSSFAAGVVENLGTGSTYVTNNTIAGNTTTSNSSSNDGSLVLRFGTAPFASNNIAWGNTRADLDVANAPLLMNNDIGVIGNGGIIDAASAGNLAVDPQFSATTDFHLQATSPLLGAGTLTPAGNLPTIDIEGHPRSYNGLVDMGAYERGDKIFADGYDN